jgi:hypothetical protein
MDLKRRQYDLDRSEDVWRKLQQNLEVAARQRDQAECSLGEGTLLNPDKRQLVKFG